jgi:hypothetical protein
MCRVEDATLVSKTGKRALLNYVARVIRAPEDPGAIDGSDPTSICHAVELAPGRRPARFAELV